MEEDLTFWQKIGKQHEFDRNTSSVPVNCARCGNPLHMTFFSQSGITGFFCSEKCLIEAKADPKFMKRG